jgi:endonuclease YncB( thermonuclease family)
LASGPCPRRRCQKCRTQGSQLKAHGKDKRTLTEVFLPDGTNINHTLVKDGWCWWYGKYAPGDTVLEGLEKEARKAKKDLWVDPAHVPPWE